MFAQLGKAALLGAMVLLSPVTLQAAAAKDKIKVLIIDGQNNHNWKATTPFMKKVLEDSGRFSVDVATSPQRVNAPAKPKEPTKPKDSDDEKAAAAYRKALEKYQADLEAYPKALEKSKIEQLAYQKAMAEFHPDLGKYQVVLSNYNGDNWSKSLNEDLEEAVKSGKVALVIVHAANNSFGSWLEYNRMIGMGWRGNSFGERLTLDDQGQAVRVPKGTGPGAGHGAGHAFRVIVRNGDHPITKGMPKEWMHASDELYHGMRGPIENVTLLATAFSDKKSGGTGEHEPMIWTVSYGKGRVFHTPMGHDLSGMRCVGFVTTLLRGTEWAALGTVTLPVPENFPTPEKTSSVSTK